MDGFQYGIIFLFECVEALLVHKIPTYRTCRVLWLDSPRRKVFHEYWNALASGRRTVRAYPRLPLADGEAQFLLDRERGKLFLVVQRPAWPVARQEASIMHLSNVVFPA